MSATDQPTRRRDALLQSETAKAAGLAVSMIIANGVALLLTIIFARLLGAEGYGSLAALTSTFLIMSVPGAAMQVAAAREAATGRLGTGHQLAATMVRWTVRLGLATLALTAVAVLLRKQLAAAIGVDETWAAAATVTTGCVWLLLSIQRGVLTGIHAYRPVGISIILESVGRLLAGLALILLGLSVTGAYLGYPLAMAITSVILAWELHHRLGRAARHPEQHPLRRLFMDAWAPVIGLTLIGVLQNIDVIVAKHDMTGTDAGAYAAAAVAAKVVIWTALGVGMHMVPDAARRNAAGTDARVALLRALALISVVAIPMLLIFLIAPEPLLRLGFGSDLTGASSALIILGGAMTVLAITYLGVQYLLALHRFVFLIPLAVVAALEPVLLSLGHDSTDQFAAVVLGMQALAAAVVLGIVVISRAGAPSGKRERPVEMNVNPAIGGQIDISTAREP
jgi:O-antigen/teichoic acid export membrane protein